MGGCFRIPAGQRQSLNLSACYLRRLPSCRRLPSYVQITPYLETTRRTIVPPTSPEHSDVSSANRRPSWLFAIPDDAGPARYRWWSSDTDNYRPRVHRIRTRVGNRNDTTLVRQSIGAGDRHWAKRLGTRAILLTALCAGAIGVALALAGPWLLHLFVDLHDAEAAARHRTRDPPSLARSRVSVL